MTNQLITNRLAIDYSLISLMSLMSSISYVWNLLFMHQFHTTKDNRIWQRFQKKINPFTPKSD